MYHSHPHSGSDNKAYSVHEGGLQLFALPCGRALLIILLQLLVLSSCDIRVLVALLHSPINKLEIKVGHFRDASSPIKIGKS